MGFKKTKVNTIDFTRVDKLKRKKYFPLTIDKIAYAVLVIFTLTMLFAFLGE